MSSEYHNIKSELGLRETHVRELFEQYCSDTATCAYKLEWSCKASPEGVKHHDRFVHVSSMEHRATWIEAGERLLRGLRPDATGPEWSATLTRLSRHAQQLFVGYSGEVEGTPDAERIKLYYSLRGECDGLWSEAMERIGRSSLDIRAPTGSAWLYVFVLSPSRPTVHRVDLVYDSIEFRDQTILRELRSFLREDELSFIGGEARGIASLRQAEREMLYSYVEFCRDDSPLRAIARSRAAHLPQFLERLGGLTWLGVPRGDMTDLENGTLTLYTKIDSLHPR
ncbi:hypothetical protein [Haliangium sp.]|uniref:hypothetical protein n=1 Tax=Haliangium sp. TaxID=2663208 RepID=UPI003D12FC3D